MSVGMGYKYGYGQNSVQFGYHGQSRSGYPAIGYCVLISPRGHPRRRRAVLWLLADLVIFRTQQRWELTLQDFIDLMKRSKWKLYQSHKREARMGYYLSVIDMGKWRDRHEHVIGPGGGYDRQRHTSRNDGQRLGYGNVGQPHHRWNQGQWRSKRLHSDLKSTHQNTTDSVTSLRDFLFPITSRVCTAIEHWIKSYRNKNIPERAKFSAFVQTGPGTHPVSCTKGTGSFPGGKEWPRRDADTSPPSSAAGKKG